MSFVVNREGGVSVIRVGAIFAVIGVVGIVGGILSFTLDQNSRKQPLNIETYDGAILLQEAPRTQTVRERLFQIEGVEPDQVAGFYDSRLNVHYGNNPNDLNRERCVRIPARGEADGYQAGTGTVPFYYTCMFDNSGFFASQFTKVIIQPGVVTEENNFEGSTLVLHEEHWQP